MRGVEVECKTRLYAKWSVQNVNRREHVNTAVSAEGGPVETFILEVGMMTVFLF